MAPNEYTFKYLIPGDRFRFDTEDNRMKHPTVKNDDDSWYIVDEVIDNSILKAHNQNSGEPVTVNSYEEIYLIEYKKVEEDCEPTNNAGSASVTGCACGVAMYDDDGSSLEIDDYVPDELFPPEATVPDSVTVYSKSHRSTPWTIVDSVNENNKEIVDRQIEKYRGHNPEKTSNLSDLEILFKCDDIWSDYGLYDSLVLNALKNKDYIVGFEYDKDSIRQYDVYFPETLFGNICNPVVFFGIKKKMNYWAEYVLDDYGEEKYVEMQIWRSRREKLHLKEYKQLLLRLLKEGHITWKLRKDGPRYESGIRYVDRKEKDKSKMVHHDQW